MKTLEYPTTSSSNLKRGLAISIFLLLALTVFKLSAQTTSYQSIPSNSSVKVTGSSNLHDWTMKDEVLTAEAAFIFKDGKLVDMTALNFTMKVKNLKSDEELLNTRAYKAMNADKYSSINFKLSSASATPLSNGHYTIKAYGKLQISGVSKDVILYADAVQNNDQTITCSGTEKLKMSDYGISPPSFMFGALKVKDDLNISFNLKFKN